MRIKKASALIAAPFIALSLSACGGSGNSALPTATQESSETESTSPLTMPVDDGTTPSEPEETTPSEPEETTPSDTDDVDPSDKPSREEVKAGLTTGIESSGASQLYVNMGATPEQLDGFYTCIVDNLYDEVSTETLQGIASGDVNAQIPQSDYETVFNANQQCGQQLLSELGVATG